MNDSATRLSDIERRLAALEGRREPVDPRSRERGNSRPLGGAPIQDAVFDLHRCDRSSSVFLKKGCMRIALPLPSDDMAVRMLRTDGWAITS